MLFRDQEKEIAELNYELHKQAIDQELCQSIEKIKELKADAVWLKEMIIDETCYWRICFCEQGIAVFLKFDRELTDLILCDEIIDAREKILQYLDGIDEDVLSFYVVLNGPITQSPYYALYDPHNECLYPVKDLEKTLVETFFNNTIVYSEEDILNILSAFEEKMLEPERDENVYIDESGEYVRVRKSWKPRSSVNAEKYYLLTLYGGIFGFHKFYAKCYGAFFVYLLTFGFFGVGWILDLAEIFFGISKDRRKAYIGPFYDKKKKGVILLFASVIYIVCLFLLFRVF